MDMALICLYSALRMGDRVRSLSGSLVSIQLIPKCRNAMNQRDLSWAWRDKRWVKLPEIAGPMHIRTTLSTLTRRCLTSFLSRFVTMFARQGFLNLCPRHFQTVRLIGSPRQAI